jgi:hypothetical protein
VSVHAVALAVRNSSAPEAAKEAYLEELIVRRELAVNFVARNPNYDRLSGCPGWALDSLARHRADRRTALYTEAELEAAETADPLWNAAQKEMVISGRMHGYLRMYWGKKLVEWTESPEEARDCGAAQPLRAGTGATPTATLGSPGRLRPARPPCRRGRSSARCATCRRRGGAQVRRAYIRRINALGGVPCDVSIDFHARGTGRRQRCKGFASQR